MCVRQPVEPEPPDQRGRQTDRSVTLDPLCSLDSMVQTGPAQVDILAVVVGGEQPQQAGQDDVVIVIHVAEPPATHTVSIGP